MEHRNQALLKLIEIVLANPHKYTYRKLQELTGLSYDQIVGALRRAELKKYILQEKTGNKSSKITPERRVRQLIPNAPDTKSIMVIGDLHEPFTLEGYREFCIETAKKYGVTHVIFIGDIIDNHYSSFHISDPDGMGGGQELQMAFENVGEWVKAFPRADVTLGNHDRIIMRKAFEGQIPRRWIMDYQDVLGAPGWNFTESVMYDGIHFIHGEGATARTRARKDLISTVQGHRHPEAYTEYIVGQAFKIFGMQVGCGIDRHSYAMAYAKDHPKPAIGVGIILDNGRQPINVLMNL
jgi:metallophosphoesterase superfamily enzyme